MRRLFAAVPSLLLVALLCACGGGGDASPSPMPAFPGDVWSIEYSKGGGIAGINQRLVLDSKGVLVTEDVGRKRQPRQGNVAPSDVSLMRGRIQAANLPSLKSDQGLPHPDAIVTSLKVISNGTTYGATFNTTPASPEVADLLQRLDKLYEENRP